MVYGVPLNMFDIPDDWFFISGGYLLPEEGRKMFKMRFSYQLSTGTTDIGAQYPCNTMYPTPDQVSPFFKPEYVIVKAEKIE